MTQIELLDCGPWRFEDRFKYSQQLYIPCSIHLGLGKYIQAQKALDKFIKEIK